MNKLVIIGIIVAVLGVIGFAVPVITTHHTEDVAKIGDFKVQTKEEEHHTIPPAASAAVLVLGIVLIGAGVMKGKQA
jgi:hypothetical protein